MLATLVAVTSWLSMAATPDSPAAPQQGNAQPNVQAAPLVQAAPQPPARWWGRPPIGYLYFSGYYDTRKSLRLTGQAMALLPYGFDYFGFVDYDNAYDAPKIGEFDRYYGEQNVMWGPRGWGVDVHAQWAMGGGASGEIPDVLRGGIRWRVDALPRVATWFQRQHILARMTYFPLVYRTGGNQVPGFHSQLSGFYRWEIAATKIDRRVYVSGWVDLDIFSKGEKHVELLTEHQLGLRLIATFYAVAEFRHLYLDKFARSGQETGVGFGLEYQIPFALPTAR
jgi:hypothetical protein